MTSESLPAAPPRDVGRTSVVPSCPRIAISSTACERDESAFSLVNAVALPMSALATSAQAASAEVIVFHMAPSTYTPSSGCSRSVRFDSGRSRSCSSSMYTCTYAKLTRWLRGSAQSITCRSARPTTPWCECWASRSWLRTSLTGSLPLRPPQPPVGCAFPPLLLLPLLLGGLLLLLLLLPLPLLLPLLLLPEAGGGGGAFRQSPPPKVNVFPVPVCP